MLIPIIHGRGREWYVRTAYFAVGCFKKYSLLKGSCIYSGETLITCAVCMFCVLIFTVGRLNLCESAAAMYIHIVTLVVLFLLPGTDVLSFTKRGEALKLPPISILEAGGL